MASSTILIDDPTPQTPPGSSGAGSAPRSDEVADSWWSSRQWRGISLGLLLAGIGCLYIIGLSASGWANSFYSAAAQAGSQSWKALFFGSLDGANFITVDKPPAFLWIIGISVRVLGVNSWAVLVPQALEGVATAAILYLTVRRVLTRGGPSDSMAADAAILDRAHSATLDRAHSATLDRAHSATLDRAHWAAMAAAAVFATVPSATLMFRYNNPDALLVLLLVTATACTLRACEKGSRGWLAWAGVAVGFAFLTKMMQAFLVLPPLVLAYAITAPRSWRHRIVDLATALVTMIVSAGWYIALFELAPTSWRPYMGGSQTNSFLELVLGYNGFGRLTGNETGSVVPGGTGGAGSWGQTGITRLFSSTSAGMVAWLIPAALILSAVAVVLIGRRGWACLRTPRDGAAATSSTLTLAGLVTMAGSLIVTLLTFSYMSGIYHDYYTVALSPWIGGSIALGAAVCWSHRDRWTGRVALAAATAVSAGYASWLLVRTGGSWLILAAVAGVLGAVSSLGLLLGHLLPDAVARTSLALALAAGLTGPLGYSINTAATAHSGAIVTAGPVSAGGTAGAGTGRTAGPGGAPGAGSGPGGAPGAGGRTAQNGPGGGPGGVQSNGTASRGGGQPGGAGGTTGGLNGSTEVSSTLRDLLSADAGSYTWVAAVTGANPAAGYQLATGHPVMAIGGYNGTDPAPTLAQFKQLVAQGRIHYYISAGTDGQMGGQSSTGSKAASEIASWVTGTFTSRTVGGTTVYDLTQAAS